MDPHDPHKNPNQYAHPQHLHLSSNSPNTLNGSYQYSSHGGMAPNGQLTGYYPQQSANAGYASPWNQSAMMGQSMHPNDYTSNAVWGHSQQPMPSAGYQGGWMAPSPGYGSYQYQQPQFMPQFSSSNSYDSMDMLGQQGYVNGQQAAFRPNGNQMNQTISPAAIQNFSLEGYGALSSHDEPTSFTAESRDDTREAAASPPSFQLPQLTVAPAAIEPAPAREPDMDSTGDTAMMYNAENSDYFAARIPAFTWEGKTGHIDPKVLMAATDSEPFGPEMPFVFISKESIPAEESRTILSKSAPRRWSTTTMRKDILEAQGDHPWTPEQQVLLKKLKITSSRKHKKLAAAATSTKPAGGTVDRQSESESEASASDEEASDDDFDDQETSPLPAVRPSDNVGQLQYDIISATWAPSSAALQADDLRQRFTDLVNVVKKVRDRSRTVQAELEEAEEKKEDAGRLDAAKFASTKQRKEVEAVIFALLDHGHVAILEKFATIPLLLLWLNTTLGDQARENAYDDKLSIHILKLLALPSKIPIDKVKVEKTIAKWLKRSSGESKELATLLSNRFAAIRDPAAVKDASAASGESKKGTGKLPEPTAGVKRVRENDTGPQQSAKKGPAPAPPRSGPQAASNKPASNSIKLADNRIAPSLKVSSKTGNGLSGTKTKSNASATGKATTTASTGAGSNPVASSGADASSKAKLPMPKSTSMFSGLKAASKKSPGTGDSLKSTTRETDVKATRTESDHIKKATVTVDAPKAPPKAAPKAPPKPSFSFSATLASLNKPKEPTCPTPKSVEKRPPETEEERKKRERKEQRRHLRVSFPPDDRLTQIRIFHSHPEEERGSDDHLTRDAADVRNEGLAMKMHKELEYDEEEEYEPPEEEYLVEWHDPALSDLQELPNIVSIPSWETRGGTKAVQSPEKQAQEERERTTLIAVYASPQDIPSSPREPLDRYAGGVTLTRTIGEPPSFVREREPRRSQASGAGATPDVASLLKILQQSHANNAASQPVAQQYQQPAQASYYPTTAQQSQTFNQYPQFSHSQAPAPAPTAQNRTQPGLDSAGLANLEAVFARFATQTPSNPAPAPPTVQAAPAIDPSIQNALNIFNQQQRHQTQAPMQGQAYPHMQQQYPATAPTNPSSGGSEQPSLLTLLNSLKSLPPQPQSTQSQQPQQTGSESAESYRKRALDTDDQYQDAKRNKNGSSLPPNYKTVVCRFFREGTCRKGDACTYLHE